MNESKTKIKIDGKFKVKIVYKEKKKLKHTKKWSCDFIRTPCYAIN